MSRNGRDRRKPCGRRTALLAALRSDSDILAFVAALRTIDLEYVSPDRRLMTLNDLLVNHTYHGRNQH